MRHALSSDKTLGQLIKERPARSHVFKELGIDHSSHPQLTLKQAVLTMLEATEGASTVGGDHDTVSMSLVELCDHIEQVHHGFLREELPRLESLAQKVVDQDAHRWPWTIELAEFFTGFHQDLISHITKEEMILFNFIRKLESGQARQASSTDHLEGVIGRMEFEHDGTRDALEQMKELGRDYKPPAKASEGLKTLLAAMANLEEDLNQHICKETNILYPRILEHYCS
jgi:regulator of cell morphogenesis and NO signaling